MGRMAELKAELDELDEPNEQEVFMENIDEFQKRSITAAEEYLYAKRTMLPPTVLYVFTDTYNYLLTKIKSYV